MTEHTYDFPLGDDYGLNVSLVEAVREVVEQGSQQQLLSLLEPLHEADIADILEQISPSEREALLTLWGKEIDGGVLSELEEGIRDEVMRDLPDEVLAEAVRVLDTDDVVYLVEDLDEPQQEKLLEKLEGIDRIAVVQALTYGEDTAGRLMQREMVVAPEHWSVGSVIDYMREADHLPESFYDVIVVDPMMHPVGEVRLARIMGAAREVPIAELMEKDFRTIPVDQDIEDVAYAFNQYHMLSAPVVDADGRLVGVITIDDAMEVLEDEVEEDMNRLAGLGDEDLSSKVWRTTKARFPWLAVNLATSILASIVIAQFTDVIEAIVALAVLLPIVASMGGNAATQTLTVAVRAIATRDLTPSNAMRIVLRETLVGLANGVVFAVIIGIVGVVWFGDPMLGVVLGLAMVANLLVAGMAGILVPITLNKLGADPALASGAFVTAVTDIVGFFSFLGLAALMLL
ncbi:MAG: magnesium transporter [Rhodobacteraceae bacterium]|nr:magnesium transporter [Paracoccaceae bacterium]